MRNPVERAYSHYQHNIRNNREHTSFSQRLDEEFKVIKEISDLSNILEVFKKTVVFERYGTPILKGLYVNYIRTAQDLGLDFLPVCLENLHTDFGRCWNEIVDFLGISTDATPFLTIWNRALYPEMDTCDRQRLEEFYEKYNEQLFSLVGESYPW